LPVLTTPASRFRAVAVAEALSWVGLLIGMYVKYLGGGHEIGVQVFGPIHGVIFLGFVLVTVLTARTLGWDRRTTALALVSSVPPLATVLFERWASRTGRLAHPAPAAAEKAGAAAPENTRA
jgi:integral membrane protein